MEIRNIHMFYVCLYFVEKKNSMLFCYISLYQLLGWDKPYKMW